MDTAELGKIYQWHYRRSRPRRPSWFTQWPGGNRIAVTLNIMHEWESVPRSITVRKRAMESANTHLDFLALGAREYGANFGFQRLLNVLDKFDIQATVFTSGLMAELFPETLKEAAQRGHEIACHHWDQSRHPFDYDSAEQEREAMVRSIEAIEKASGIRPVGYMSPGPRPSPYTLELCASLGFKWNGDYCDSDVPYMIDVDGKRLVSLGYVRPAYTDNDLLALGLAGALQQLKDEFDAHYEEGADHPMKFRYAMHNFTGGRPGLAKVLERFLAYAKSQPNVWFCRCIDIAEFWAKQEKIERPGQAAKLRA
ncbi:MAG TPA: polysaccharide deacetylase family protein [Acidobacteriota bacterium]|nr:polysaccharide deacetylase family protein [Acidobacteriota bacterium]